MDFCVDGVPHTQCLECVNQEWLKQLGERVSIQDTSNLPCEMCGEPSGTT